MSVDSFHPVTAETKLSLPLNGSVYTTTVPVPAEKSLFQIGASAETLLGPSFKSSLIIQSSNVPSDSQKSLTIVHARIPRESDQLASNWEFSTCSIGGRQFPSVQRTVILIANSSYVPVGETMDVFAHDSPAIGSAMPVETGSQFSSKGYLLADRQVISSNMQLEPVFRVERRNYVIKSSRTSIGIDPLNGKALYSTTTLYYKGETILGTAVESLFANPSNPYWGLQADGTSRSGEQLTCSWYSITSEQVVAGTPDGNGVIAIDSYETTESFYWPPVFDGSIEYLVYPRRDGGEDIYPSYIFSKDGYNGPCKATISRTWKRSAFTGLYNEKLLPTPISFNSPFFSLSVPACLHASFTTYCNIGNNDPVFKPSNNSKTTPVTKKSGQSLVDQTDWPGLIRSHDEQVPYRGGFLRTTVTIYAPNT